MSYSTITYKYNLDQKVSNKYKSIIINFHNINLPIIKYNVNLVFNLLDITLLKSIKSIKNLYNI